MRKRIAACVLAVLLICTLMSTALAWEDTVLPGDWVNLPTTDIYEYTFEPDVRWVQHVGLMSGKSNGDFDKEGTLTRAELAKVLCLIYIGDVDGFYSEQVLTGKLFESYEQYKSEFDLPKCSTKISGFSDVKASDWFVDYAYACQYNGLLNGSNGKFNPKGKLTLAETCKALCNLFCLPNTGFDEYPEMYYPEYEEHTSSDTIEGWVASLNSGTKASAWQVDAMQKCMLAGFFGRETYGGIDYHPVIQKSANDPITRGEFAFMLHMALRQYEYVDAKTKEVSSTPVYNNDMFEATAQGITRNLAGSEIDLKGKANNTYSFLGIQHPRTYGWVFASDNGFTHPANFDGCTNGGVRIWNNPNVTRGFTPVSFYDLHGRFNCFTVYVTGDESVPMVLTLCSDRTYADKLPKVVCINGAVRDVLVLEETEDISIILTEEAKVETIYASATTHVFRSGQREELPFDGEFIKSNKDAAFS